MSNLVQQFKEYSDWRKGLVTALEHYRQGLDAAGLSDAASNQRFQNMFGRLADDKLSIAFVSEFSRGKSELINAIFFAGYGKRIVPSSAGRTTMCPTELMYDETLPPSIRLLPIETRAGAGSTSDFKSQGHAWTVHPLNVTSADGMMEAFNQVSLTKRVSIEEAKSYGLYDEDDPDANLTVGEDGMIEISRWRHAIVNFPHPLLKEGLVILDTPGLNAIGTEPELTLNLIPNAHAVLFILAADTGVTKSDIDVWKEHIGAGAGRMVVLNKIDSMWDELRTADEIERQISGQVTSVAGMLGLKEKQVFPVSAQKGLVAKIGHDGELLDKSRLPLLENALSSELIPAKKDIIRQQLAAEINALIDSKHALLSARTRGAVEQLFELKSLRGKNSNVIQHMMKRLDAEKKDFDGSLIKLQGTRGVFARLSADVFTSLGMEVLKETINQTRETMGGSRLSTGLRGAVKQFFEQTRNNLALSDQKIAEIFEMMNVMYHKFSSEHGLAVSTPMQFSMEKYLKELDMIESTYQKQFGTLTLLTTSRVVLMQKFFDSIASRVKHSFLQSNRDVEAWLKVVIAPLEAQIREHKEQLKHRQQSVQRIHVAIDSLEDKIDALEQQKSETEAILNRLVVLENALKASISGEPTPLDAAA
ncbi:MAG: dynamin family protein [Burkholderiaceae bacterium]|nr:dynamin family protein [Burkholderiaceae bacterium]